MRVLLGVTGSISAYKAVEILRLFQKNNHDVSVILTENAMKLVPALTFETFAAGRVFSQMFSDRRDSLVHISLSQSHDLFLIAPASANIIGKMASGIADDLLSTTYLAFPGPVIVAPAMNVRMWDHPAVKDNIARLKSRQVMVIDPDSGELACGDEGKGRLPDVEKIYKFCLKHIHV